MHGMQFSTESRGIGRHRPPSQVSRRGVLGAAGGAVAVGVAAPSVLAITSSDDSSPGATSDSTDKNSGTTTEEFPRTRSESVSGETELTAGFPITYSAVRLAGAASGARIRFHSETGSKGPWQRLANDCASANDGALLVAAEGAAGFELTLPGSADGVECVAVDTRLGATIEIQIPADPTRLRGQVYQSRAAWGADESLRCNEDGTEKSPPEFYPVQTITVHHTATANDDPDPAATVRAIYEFHVVTNGWGDIGYNFLIDEAGTVYEGCYADGSGLPAHNAEGDMVTAAHVSGHNDGNLGIALLGNLMDRPPTDAARASLIQLIRILSVVHGLDPQVETTFVHPVNGTTKDVSVVSGHRDWTATDCPGQVLYDELPAILEAAAAPRTGS